MRMLCSRSATLITSTRGSRAIAVIILRMVSPSAALPSTTRSSLVTPSTRWRDLFAEFLGQLLERVPGVLDGVVQQRGHQVVVSMPNSARMLATASGWVM